MATFVEQAVVTALIGKLVDVVASWKLWKYTHTEQVHYELKKWKKILKKIQAVLHDAEKKQMTNHLVKIWLDELRDLAYDVEDILDDFATEALRSSLIMAQPQPRTSRAGGISSSRNPSALTSNFSMGSKIEGITARLQDISTQKNDLDLREIAASWSDRKGKLAQILPTTSLVVESSVYGRETDKAAIVDMLLKDGPNSDDEVSVIPIVGMAGIGKTTLAQLAFNDDQVKGKFDLRAWVCVSDDFDVLRLTKTILQSVDPGTRDVNDLNLLQVSLKEKFSEKKFLLVLDDVWNEKYGDWETLCKPMRAGAPCSKLIVTTRNEGVAAVTGTCPAYPLRELSYNDCLSLFAQQALRRRNFDAHPHLKEVGEEIVRRCKGLPLAAKALGGILHNQLNPDAWENILKSKIWDLPEDKTDIIPSLMLSYHHLPSHLKRCFAYCSMFPKDYEFNKDELVQLWMAEGFLQQRKGTRPEDLGSKYFDDLFSRSFFQHSSRKPSRFVMHGLINDLAQSVAGKICIHLDSAWENNKQSTISEKARHSSFNSQMDGDNNRRNLESLQKAKCLRTLVALPAMPFLESYSITSTVLHDLLKEVKLLRVLSLSGFQMGQLPNSIGSLKHLRYLNFSGTNIIWLPDSLGNLYNLQALLLSSCYQLDMLPMGIGNLINLRHLDISDTPKLQEMPSQIGDLTNLQTLSKFIVSQDSSLGIRELMNLSELQGELSILGLHNVLDIPDGWDANLGSRHRIEDLTMEWSDDFDGSRDERREEDVLEQLPPHGNLKKLTLASYGGSDFPSWMKNPSFPVMTHLILKDCKRCTSLPALGQLSSLKVLHIKGMSKVESIDETFYGGIGKPFPSLEVLEFEDMPEWEDWICPDAVEEAELFPCLRELKVTKCRSKQLPRYDIFGIILKRLYIEGCENLESLPEGMMHHNSTCCLELLMITDCSSLKSFPTTGQFPSTLQTLKIDYCPNLESMSENMCPNNTALEYLMLADYPNLRTLPECLHSLKELCIYDCEGLECFPARGLSTPTLTHLQIERCENLKSLPHQMRNLKSLQELTISECPGVESFPEGGLAPNLTSLEVGSCENLRTPMSEWGLHTLTSLSSLSITDMFPDMVSFPDEECLLPISLTSLTINDMKSLTSLALQNLSSLQDLNISCCLSLSALGLLPATLTHLDIVGCPIITETYMEDTGEYRPDIAYIPNIAID